MGILLTSRLLKEFFAQEVEEFDLHATQIMSNFESVHLPKADSQWPEQFATMALPQLIECVLEHSSSTDIQQKVVLFQEFEPFSLHSRN